MQQPPLWRRLLFFTRCGWKRYTRGRGRSQGLMLWPGMRRTRILSTVLVQPVHLYKLLGEVLAVVHEG